MIDIMEFTGKKFGRLTVLEYVGKNGHGDTAWRCLCDCGNETIVAGYRLKNGNTKSCGCLAKEKRGSGILPTEAAIPDYTAYGRT